MTRKSRKLRSSFCEVDHCGPGWSLIKGFISRKLSVIGMKVSFRNFAGRGRGGGRGRGRGRGRELTVKFVYN